MAKFDLAYPHIKKWEGGYVNNPKDYGGETYAGITRKNFPNELDIWEYIDFRKRVYGPIKTGQIFTALNPFVEDFYIRFWDKLQLDVITSQKLANLLFDYIVNSGSAVKNIQQIVGVEVDGIFGPKTRAAINSKDSEKLFKQILDRRKENYIKQAQTESQKDFLAGWLNRLDDFYKQVGPTLPIASILILFIILILIS